MRARAALLVLAAAIGGCAPDCGGLNYDRADPTTTGPRDSLCTDYPLGDPLPGTLCTGTAICTVHCPNGAPKINVQCVDGVWKQLSDCRRTVPYDAAPPDTAPLAPDKTVGKACTTDDECDVTGNGINLCSLKAFGGDSLFPTSVCVGNECEVPALGDPLCDDGLGLCLGAAAPGICLPLCRFHDDGAAATGCVGKNLCNAYGVASPADGGPDGDADAIAVDDGTVVDVRDDAEAGSSVSGIGYCFGGCREDLDCPMSEYCQRETGRCVRTRVAYTKPLGAGCTASEDDKACSCWSNASTKRGFCITFCRPGVDDCGAGFVCDPILDPRFTRTPTGMFGWCLKTCVADGECVNSACSASGGLAVKTCKPVKL